MSFVCFTESQKEQARRTDLVEFLRSQGETVKHSGSEYEWKDGSQKVTIRGNLWFHQYDRVGGDAIDFVRRFYNKDYVDAMEFLLGNSSGTLITSPPVVKEQKPFKLPSRNDNMRRVFAYLNIIRGIDKDVLYAFIHRKMIYESEKYHNVVFVGYDRNGNPRHACMRGTGSNSTYKGNAPNSQPEYSFHWHGQAEPAPNSRTNDVKNFEYGYLRPSNRLYLFEAPIDMLSFISMHKENWKENSYAASCSVSDRVLFQCIKDNPHIEKVYICFDNDEPGQTAAKRISQKLYEKEIQSEILVPIHKDWNEDQRAAGVNDPHYSADFFISNKNEKEDEKPCQTLVL